MRWLTKIPRLGPPACVLWVTMGLAFAGADDDFAAWENEQERVRERIAAVNEGALEFLGTSPDGAVHHHAGRILIDAQSLEDGWVTLEQCHANLDQVAEAQILFSPERSRALTVASVRNIGRAYAEDSSIQLRGIGADSSVCVRLETRALHRIDEGVFELQNGPFMRRFLDGYYPLRVSLRIDYPRDLELADYSPAEQPGFTVVASAGHVELEALFEGRLRTAFRFLRK